jgi:hypothetical protein
MKTLMFVFSVASVACVGAATASAQTQMPHAEWQARVQTLEDQVKELKAELDSLRGQMAATPPAAQQPGAVVPPAAAPSPAEPVAGGQPTAGAGTLPVYGAASAGSKIFNPDIGMIGNFISATGESRGGSTSIAPTPFATLQESEASFQAIVDPYARADFFLAIGEEGIEVEEGYGSRRGTSRSLRCRADCS